MARTSQKRSLWGRLRGAYRAFVEPLSGGILPLSTGGVKIQKGQSVQITGTPWGDPWWRPEGLFIAPKDVTDWIVNDIKIADRSQFVQAGDIPGEMFVSKEIGTFVRFQPVQRGQKIDVVVTYIGDNPEGCSFTGAMSGMVYDPSLIQTILEVENVAHRPGRLDARVARTRAQRRDQLLGDPGDLMRVSL